MGEWHAQGWRHTAEEGKEGHFLSPRVVEEVGRIEKAAVSPFHPVPAPSQKAIRGGRW